MRTALQCGLALFQVGEFSFVLAMAGIGLGLLSPAQHQLFLAVSILTMAATPMVIARSRRIAGGTFNRLLPRTGQMLDQLLRTGHGPTPVARAAYKDHLVIIGYGLAGQQVAWSAQSVKIRCVVIEEDPDLAEMAVRAGMQAIQGNAAQAEVLQEAQVATARTVLVALQHGPEARRAVQAVRAATRATVVARAPAPADGASLLRQGADKVVSDEMEGALCLMEQVLQAYHVPASEIGQTAWHLRALQHPVAQAAN